MRENYKAWDINIDDFHGLKDEREKLLFLIRFGILAPSSHNTQPWKFVIKNSKIYLLPEYSRRLKASDINGRQLFISLGCVITNISIAAEYYKYKVGIKYFPEELKDAAAVFEFKENFQVESKNSQSLKSVLRRVTNRGKFKKDLPPPDFFDKIKSWAGPDIKINYLADSEIKNSVTDIALAASIKAMDNNAFRYELSQYVKTNLTNSKLGMPCFGLGIPTLVSFFAPRLIRYLNVNRLSRKKDEDIFKNHTPVLVILSTENDDKQSWLQVGQLYEKITIEANNIGLATAMWAAPIQIDEYYKELQKVLNITARPQALFKMGYPIQEVRHSPRLQFDEVVR